MLINTCSGAISYSKELENESAKFYEAMAQKFAEQKDLFLSFVKENGKFAKQIERTYYGVISDALEGCFSFNMDSDGYAMDTEAGEGASFSDLVEKAVAIEDNIIKYYIDAAEQSQSLMADVPRVFKQVAKKRESRKSTLKSL